MTSLNYQLTCILSLKMIKIVNHQIKFKERPLKYRRDYDLIKGSNPSELTLNKKDLKKIKKGQVEKLVLK